MANLMQPDRTLSVPLSNLSEVLASPLAELEGAPLDELILRGVRDRVHVAEEGTPSLFWAWFIVELGRQAPSTGPFIGPYDMLIPVASTDISLNAVQLALVLQRLIGDLAAFSGVTTVGAAGDLRAGDLAPQGGWSFVKRAYAQEQRPCTLSGTEGVIVDGAASAATTGFGALMGYLEEQGMKAAGKLAAITGYANLLSTYLKLVWTQAAFDIGMGMDGAGPPLERTKAPRPRSGEQRTLAALVTMDIGDAQWANCFRLVLNAAGLDFSLPNDGPVKGASVQWIGVEGFNEAAEILGEGEQLVRFYGSDPTRHTTDAAGVSRIGVEGVGQPGELRADVEQVAKYAKVRAMVALKPADLFQDLTDAAGTAAGGVAGLLVLPAEMLYRTHWTLGATYTFQVLDWDVAPQQWSGTITYTFTEHSSDRQETEDTCCYGRSVHRSNSYEESEETVQTWTIGGQGEPQRGGRVVVPADFAMSVERDYYSDSDHTGWNSCRGEAEPTWGSVMENETSRASLIGQAEVTITFQEGGTYVITASAAPGHAEGMTEYVFKATHGPGCEGTPPPETETETYPFDAGAGADAFVEGRIDPNDPGTLSGSETRTEVIGDATLTTTYTWDLTRS
jgi:hypothetical protein